MGEGRSCCSNSVYTHDLGVSSLELDFSDLLHLTWTDIATDTVSHGSLSVGTVFAEAQTPRPSRFS
jgi:hypothetical protein